MAGCVGLHHIEGHKAEIGYWLSEKHWGEGIMPEAVKLVTNYAFETLGLKRIYAPVFLPNKQSARALEKAGYELEGVLRKNCSKDGKFYDEVLYAKVN